jgi:hypothetical protein
VADDLIAVQLGDRGKWHIAGRHNKTECGLDILPNPSQKYLDLVDSNQRCKAEGCVRARLNHKGLR